MRDRSLFRLVLATALFANLVSPLRLSAQADPSGESKPASPTAGILPAATTPTTPPAPPEDAPLPETSAVRLGQVDGSVRVIDTNGQPFSQARENMTLLPGMRVETGTDGRVELQFADGSLARVTPNSALSLGGGAGQFALRPTIGLSYYELTAASTLTVQVGPVVARTSASATDLNVTTLLRVNLDSTPYEAAVLHGAVHFEDVPGNVTYDVVTNQTARIDPGAVNNYDIVPALTGDTWDAWNADRDKALAELANGSGDGHNAGDPGWTDLDYYGRWYNVPGQGLAWAPDGAGQDFDPYGSGAWTYSTDAGYSWVSSYPWGWLPYHCGFWNYYGGSGWMWVPQGCGWGAEAGAGGGWYPYPPAHGGPPGYRPPRRPIHRVPRAGQPAAQLPVIAVQRVPQVHFREPGSPRPVARSFQIAGETVEPLRLAPRPTYQGSPESGYSLYRSGPRAGEAVYGAGGQRLMPTQPSGMRAPVQGSGYAPPHVSVPRASAPAPAAPSAPRASAPAAPAAPSSGGRPH